MASAIQHFNSQLIQLADTVTELAATEVQPEDGFDHLDSSIDKLISTLKEGKQALGGLGADDDIEWVYEGRGAIQSVKGSLEHAGEMMTLLMDILESHPDSSARGFDMATKIQISISEWYQMLALVDTLRNQVSLSVEWKELNNAIFTDLVEELNTCDVLVFNITQALSRLEEKSKTANLSGSLSSSTSSKAEDIEIDIDLVSAAISESPFGNSRLLSLSASDREMNQDFIELHARLEPLGASLQILPERVTRFRERATEFPTSVSTLETKLEKLDGRFHSLNAQSKTIESQLQNRWNSTFSLILQQCTNDMERVKENLQFIRESESRAKKGLKIDRIKMDRYATQNGYIIPGMAKALALLHRAIADNLCTDASLETDLESIQSQWINLLTNSSPNGQNMLNVVSLGSPRPTNRQTTIMENGAATSFSRDIPSLQRTPPPVPKLATASLYTPGLAQEPSTPTPAPSHNSSYSLAGPDILPLRGLAIKGQRRHSKVSSASSTGSMSSGKVFSPNTTAASNPSSPEVEEDDITLSGHSLRDLLVSSGNGSFSSIEARPSHSISSSSNSSTTTLAPPESRKSARTVTPTSASHLPVSSPQLARTKRPKFQNWATPTSDQKRDINSSPSMIPRSSSRASSSRQGMRSNCESRTGMSRGETPRLSDSFARLSLTKQPHFSPPRAQSSIGVRIEPRQVQSTRLPRRKVSTPTLTVGRTGPIDPKRPWRG